MKRLVTHCCLSILILISYILQPNLLAASSDILPDSTIWEFKGVVLKNADSAVFEPIKNSNAVWDNQNKTYKVMKIPHLVFNLNTYDEVSTKPYLNYGERGGDYLITKILDIRKLKSPYLTFLYQRAGKYPNRGNTGWSDTILYGPERRVVLNDTSGTEYQKPDMLLIEFAYADSVSVSKLNSLLESDWNIHPGRFGMPPVTNNPAMSIFGGGGYRRGFLENDKDSALSYEKGLRKDLNDVGNDDGFNRVYIPIPDTLVKNGFIRVRFRVDAERNGDGVNVVDDNDDFYLDDIRVEEGKPDISLNSFYILNPYSILNLNTKYAVPVYVNITGINTNTSDSFNLKIRIKHEDDENWPATPDEEGFTGNEPYSYYFTFPVDTISTVLKLPSLPLKSYAKYLKRGNNKFQLWAVIGSSNGNSVLTNDTLFYEFQIYLDSSIAYDNPENPINDFERFTKVKGRGLQLFGYNIGKDISEWLYNEEFVGSGTIAMNFSITETDTVYGYQAFWGDETKKLYDISFKIIQSGNQPGEYLIPGSDMNRKIAIGDFNQDTLFNAYITYLLPKPVILKPSSSYYLEINQNTTRSFNLGGSAYGMGIVTTCFDSTIDEKGYYSGLKGNCHLVERNNKRFNNNTKNWITNNIFYYENVKGTSNWTSFFLYYNGNPAYAHLNHAGEISGGYKTFSRGSFVPMIRLYMDGSHYKWETDVNDNKDIGNISISPNPASDYIEISVGAQRAVPDCVSIYDVLGMEITTPSTSPLPLSILGDGKIKFDVSHLSPGVYFVRVGNDVRKFIKI